MNIYLIGMPGCGKTKTAKTLSSEYGYNYVDLDDYIEKMALMSIDEIFKRYGETYFRELETRALKECDSLENSVIATGGGIIKNRSNKSLIKNGVVIFLDASIEKIKMHLEGSHQRPLLKIYSLESLYEERIENYLFFMDYRINYDSYTESAKICHEIANGKYRKKVLVVNGPNLNMLGKRDPKHYGSLTLASINDLIAKETYFDYEFFQSNHEGAIIDRLQDLDGIAAIIINAGAYTHTSVALHDCLEIISIPKLEVHLSEVDNREDYRKINFIRDVCDVCYQGKHEESYLEAVHHLKKTLNVI